MILCLLLGVLYAAVLYYRDIRFDESPRWSRWLMAALRTLAVASIAALLLSPMVKTTTETIKQPIVVIAEDASKSVVSDMDADQVAAYQSQLSQITSELAGSYEVKRISLGDEVSEGVVDSFTSNITNLSNALEYIDDNYGDQNLGAIILATDGIYNEGKNPLYTNTNITSPLYTIAMGDTSLRKDLSVKNVFHNKIAYLNDKFSIQIDIAAINAANANTTLTIQKVTDSGRTKLHSENIALTSNTFFTTREVVIPADQVGVVRYRISLSTVSGEVSTANNYKDIYVEVLDARQKILLLANAPHPDLTALKQIITKNKNYEADIKLVRARDYRVSDYDMVVLHNLPTSGVDLSQEKAAMDRRRTPRLYIVGSQTDATELNRLQNVISLSSNGRSLEDIQPTLSPNFNSFTISEQLSRSLAGLPPLVAPFGEYKDPLGANILLKQKIKDVETDYPLLAFREGDGYKTGVWVGEGLWKWRMYNYIQTENYELVEELVNKTIQYVSTKEDKRKFRASSSKNLYKENENILFDAQLYNDNYELVNEVEVFLKLVNQDKKEFDFTFSKTNSYYTLNANLLPPGKYSYTASTTYDGEAMSQKGYFSVQDIQLELYDLTARHGLLKALSNKYGGKVVLPTESSTLVSMLTGENALKPVVYPSTKTKSIINFRWLFWILLGLLCFEWFLRRYMGNY